MTTPASVAAQGQRVRQLREARGWSHADLAAKASTTPVAVRNWETGRQKIAPHELGPLAYALGVQPDDLELSAIEHHRRQEQAAHRAELLAAGWLPADLPGTCARCDRVFQSRTLIVRDGTGWRAECCS